MWRRFKTARLVWQTTISTQWRHLSSCWASSSKVWRGEACHLSSKWSLLCRSRRLAPLEMQRMSNYFWYQESEIYQTKFRCLETYHHFSSAMPDDWSKSWSTWSRTQRSLLQKERSKSWRATTSRNKASSCTWKTLVPASLQKTCQNCSLGSASCSAPPRWIVKG